MIISLSLALRPCWFMQPCIPWMHTTLVTSQPQNPKEPLPLTTAYKRMLWWRLQCQGRIWIQSRWSGTCPCLCGDLWKTCLHPTCPIKKPGLNHRWEVNGCASNSKQPAQFIAKKWQYSKKSTSHANSKYKIQILQPGLLIQMLKKQLLSRHIYSQRQWRQARTVVTDFFYHLSHVNSLQSTDILQTFEKKSPFKIIPTEIYMTKNIAFRNYILSTLLPPMLCPTLSPRRDSQHHGIILLLSNCT